MDKVHIDVTHNESNNMLVTSLEVDTGDINTIIRTAKINTVKQDYDVKIGDKIKVQAGYDPMYPIFNGYITDIQREDDVMLLTCEDEAWKTKSIILDEETIYNATVKILVDKYYIAIYVLNKKQHGGELGDFKLEGTPTFFDLLNVFRERYGIISYFDTNRILHIDLLRTINDTVVDLVYGNVPEANVIDEQAENLQQKQDDARKRIIYGVSRQKDDTYVKRWAFIESNKVKISKTAKTDGYVDKLEINGISATELEYYISLRLEKGVYAGLVGEIPLIFTRFVRPFDQVRFVDKRTEPIYANEKYVVDRVIYSFDEQKGLIQRIFINYKV